MSLAQLKAKYKPYLNGRKAITTEVLNQYKNEVRRYKQLNPNWRTISLT